MFHTWMLYDAMDHIFNALQAGNSRANRTGGFPNVYYHGMKSWCSRLAFLVVFSPMNTHVIFRA